MTDIGLIGESGFPEREPESSGMIGSGLVVNIHVNVDKGRDSLVKNILDLTVLYCMFR